MNPTKKFVKVKNRKEQICEEKEEEKIWLKVTFEIILTTI